MPAVTAPQLDIDPALLQSLKGIELKSRFLVRGLYNSRHRTKDFGSSTEFVEHREYRWGDEIRRIDWRVYARTNHFFVKVHEMEANMRVHFLVDTSASMRVPPPPGLPSKLELAAVIAGALATMVIRQQDAAGLLLLADGIDPQIPARQGPAHLFELFQHLAAPRGGRGGAFGRLVQEAAARLGSRSMVFILTDALDDPDELGLALRNLRVRQQDATLIQILDRNEVEFPFDRMTEFRHPETGDRLIGDPAALRAKYLARLTAFRERLAAVCQQAQADYLCLHNGDDLAKLLTLHFVRRALRL
jgi:uncharacterized protein (DUF58 family)